MDSGHTPVVGLRRPVNELPQRDRPAGEVPRAGAVGAGAALCVGVVLIALRWATGFDVGGPELVLVGAGIAWFVGVRLAVTAHENSHWDKMITGTMEPRVITVGIETRFGMWAISVDGRPPIPAALSDEEGVRVIVDAANLCMASPRRLRKMPRLGTDHWRPIRTATVRTTGQALELVAAAVKDHKANGAGPAV